MRFRYGPVQRPGTMPARTALRLYGHLEQHGAMTAWPAYPLEGLPQFADWLLPRHGCSPGARYRLSLTLSTDRQGQVPQIGATTSTVELRARGGEVKTLSAPVVASGAEDLTGDAGTLELLGLLPEWHDTEECWVRLTFDYDPGLSALLNGDSPADLTERHRDAEYRSPEADVLDTPTDTNPAPSLSWFLPEIGATVDHEGTVRVGGQAHRLPVGVRHGFVAGDTLVLLLDQRNGGHDDPDLDPDLDLADEPALLGVTEGGIAWSLAAPNDEDIRHLWTHDGTVWAASRRTWHRVDPAAGTIIETVTHYHGRLD
jgi:hypothetical protein